MAEDAVTLPMISHALILRVEEADALLSGRSDSVRRSSPTGLRMRVGLLRDDGQLLATGMLSDVARLESEPLATDWRLREIEALPHPINMTPGAGPLWKRLGSAERNLVNGGTPPAAAEHPSGADDREDEAARLERSTSQEKPMVDATPTAFSAPSARVEASMPDDGTLERPADLHATDMISSDVENGADLRATSGGDGADELQKARHRAFAYVPEGMIDTDEAYGLLVRLRDTEIKKTFPDVRPEHGLLRRTMLQALLDSGVSSREDYDDLIPGDLKRMTDHRQIDVYLAPLIEILSRVR